MYSICAQTTNSNIIAAFFVEQDQVCSYVYWFDFPETQILATQLAIYNDQVGLFSVGFPFRIIVDISRH